MKRNINNITKYYRVGLYPLFAFALLSLFSSTSMAQTKQDPNNRTATAAIASAEYYSSLFIARSIEEPKVRKKTWLDRTVDYKMGKTDFIKSIKYPQKAIEKGVEGLVKVFFIVEPDGRASHIKVLESLDYECDQAVIQAVHNARFNPGIVNGQSVRVHCILPVYFSLKDVN